MVGFLEKWTKSVNLGNFGVLHHGVGILRNNVSPRQAWHDHATAWPRGGLDKPRVSRGVAKLRRGEGLRHSVAVLCRGVALLTDTCFCHVFLFQYSKDLSIGLMRTL